MDIVNRLRNFAVWNSHHSHYDPVPLCQEAATEIERLRAAFLVCLQAENECAKKGRICGPSDMCGCALEMEDYIDAVVQT